MLINKKTYRTIWFDDKEEIVKIIDQNKLPKIRKIMFSSISTKKRKKRRK